MNGPQAEHSLKVSVSRHRIEAGFFYNNHIILLRIFNLPRNSILFWSIVYRAKLEFLIVLDQRIALHFMGLPLVLITAQPIWAVGLD
jgi:hypothetical protein